jgi:Domain of unknown function (DUF4437)
MFNSRLALAALPSVQILLAPVTVGAAPFDSKTPQARPQETFQFDTITPFLKFSDAFGDRTKPGPHGTFGTIPAHTASPEHTHSVAYHGVVIRGVVVNPFNGDPNPPRLSPGSYWYVPANVPHVTACVSDEPCLFYTHSDGPFDVKLTEH